MLAAAGGGRLPVPFRDPRQPARSDDYSACPGALDRGRTGRGRRPAAQGGPRRPRQRRTLLSAGQPAAHPGRRRTRRGPAPGPDRPAGPDPAQKMCGGPVPGRGPDGPGALGGGRGGPGFPAQAGHGRVPGTGRPASPSGTAWATCPRPPAPQERRPAVSRKRTGPGSLPPTPATSSTGPWTTPWPAKSGEANARLKDVKNIAGTAPAVALVRAILAAVQNDAAAAVTIASDSLLDSPEELDVFLPLLQDVLLAVGSVRPHHAHPRTGLPVRKRPALAVDRPGPALREAGAAGQGAASAGEQGRPRQFHARCRRSLSARCWPTMSRTRDFAKVWAMLSMPRPHRGLDLPRLRPPRRTDPLVLPLLSGFRYLQSGPGPAEVI